MPKRFTPQDKFFHKAKQSGLRARSAFKLEDILRRFPKFVGKNQRILDLGSAPGSFLQVFKNHHPHKLVGIDLQAIEPIDGVEFFQADIFSERAKKFLHERKPFDVITSDMAPKTTGVPDTDQYHSVELCERVLELSGEILRPNGNLLLKIFTGADFDEFWKTFKSRFKKAKVFKPESCRDRSRETFLVGEGFLKKVS